MPLKILYFAWVREKTGKAEEIVDLPAGVGTVRAQAVPGARAPGQDRDRERDYERDERQDQRLLETRHDVLGDRVGLPREVDTSRAGRQPRVAIAQVEPVLSDLMPYFERDEARHVGLGVLYLPKLLAKRNMDFFCLNDGSFPEVPAEERAELVTDFLEKYYPIKAPWEK